MHYIYVLLIIPFSHTTTTIDSWNTPPPPPPIFDKIDNDKAGIIPLSKFVGFIETLGEGFNYEELARVICGNQTQMKVVVWTVLPLWGGMWTMRYLWNPQKRQKVWWVGASRSAGWTFSEKYLWMFIHWRGNVTRKGYLWRWVQVKFNRTASEDRGASFELLGIKILSDCWWFMRNKKCSNK